MMLTLNRPAKLESDAERLAAEYRSARWAHHRLLDFEDEHQRILDAAAEAVAPGILRVGRILSRLARRAKRRTHTNDGVWSPNPRPALEKKLRTMLATLRENRNADPRWAKALGWADEQTGEPKQIRRRRAKPAAKVRRRKTESEEAFARRFAKLTTDETEEHFKAKVAAAPRRTRREEYRAQVYAQRRCYWGTWNALVKSVDQARADVLRRRTQGLSAQWRRPKFRDPISLCADEGGWRVVERGDLWWTVDLRIGIAAEWVRVRAKCGNWHACDPSQVKTAKLTRRPDGERWIYSLSLTADGISKGPTTWAQSGIVAFDWGHREHGHDTAAQGLRAFVWRGDDGATGEVLVPRECRAALDEIDALKSRLDEAFARRKGTLKLDDRNRFGYRRRIKASGVRTEEEARWLQWEMRYERRINARRKRVANLRREIYTRAVRDLRQRYALFAFEAESIESIKRLQKEEEIRRRKRSNRDLATRYEFVSLCERFGAAIIEVPARNTTRECPDCGELDDNGPELLMVCHGCGIVRDKDHGAARVILRRAERALANRVA